MMRHTLLFALSLVFSTPAFCSTVAKSEMAFAGAMPVLQNNRQSVYGDFKLSGYEAARSEVQMAQEHLSINDSGLNIFADDKNAEKNIKQLAAKNKLPEALYRAQYYYHRATKRGSRAADYQANLKRAMEIYSQVDYKYYSVDDFLRNTLCCVANGYYGYVVDNICPAALNRHPRTGVFNRLAFTYARMTGDRIHSKKNSKPWYDKAAKYGYQLIHNTVDGNITATDHYNLAYVYFKQKNFNAAVSSAQQAAMFRNASDKLKKDCSRLQIESFAGLGNFDRALSLQRQLNSSLNRQGKLTYTDLEHLVDIYMAKLSKQTDDVSKEAIYNEVLKIYDEMGKRFQTPDATSFAYQRVLMIRAAQDPDYKLSLALDAANRLVRYVTSLSPAQQAEYKDRLVYGYSYLAVFHYMTSNGLVSSLKKAYDNADKGLRLDPADSRCRTIYDATKQYVAKDK